jgi:hypothetical protein
VKLYHIQRQAGPSVLGTERDVRDIFTSTDKVRVALDLFFENARPGDVFEGLYREDLSDDGEPLMYHDSNAYVIALGRRFTPNLVITPEMTRVVKEEAACSMHVALEALIETEADIEKAKAFIRSRGWA